MRILTSADWHMDQKSKNSRGEERHWEESKKTVQEIVDISNEHEVDIILVAGDVFHTGNPDPEPVFNLTQQLNRLIKTKVVFITGNHDMHQRFSRITPIDAYLAQHPKTMHVCNTPEIFKARINDKELDLALVPWVDFDGKTNLKNTIEELKQKFSGKGIFSGHLTLSECGFGSGNRGSESTMIAAPSREIVIPSDFLNDSPWEYSCLGHIHKRQEYGNTYYAGSPYRTTFAEEGQKKAVDIVEFKNGIFTKKEIELNTPSSLFTLINPSNKEIMDMLEKTFHGDRIKIKSEEKPKILSDLEEKFKNKKVEVVYQKTFRKKQKKQKNKEAENFVKEKLKNVDILTNYMEKYQKTLNNEEINKAKDFFDGL